MPVKPITPQEAEKKFQEQLPDFVIEAFNQLLSEKIGVSRRCTITQEEAVARIIAEAAKADVELNCQTIFDKHYLDVEDAYRAAGWEVDFDKAGYNETRPSIFTFSKPNY